MSITQKIMETFMQYKPDQAPDPLTQNKHGYVGKPLSRVDGQLKVKGEAPFSAEYKVENLAYAAIAYSSVTKGKIKKIDVSSAEKAHGVLVIMTHENAPKINDPLLFNPGGGKGAAASALPILQQADVHWNGQPVAVIVAQTQDQAEAAAKLVEVEYETAAASVSFDALKKIAKPPANILGEPTEIKIGDAETAINAAKFKVDNIYRTPRYNHNAIEPHATIAVWHDDKSLTVFDSTQATYNVSYTLAEMFGIQPEAVRVIAPFVGGGFGGKGTMWWNTALCAMAAKVVNRPLKLSISREGVFRLVGGRTPSEQRVALGAESDGKFTALIHTGITATTTHNNFTEQFTFPVRHLYAAENFYIGQKIVNLDTVANTFMRAPGESIGTFAVESAIDELAYELKIDPIELRRINEPAKDPVRDVAFSMRNLTEAYRRGAEKFGWKHQTPRSQKDGKWLVGQGVATAYYPYYRFVSTARVRISADGTAVVQTSTHEMGMGTATVQIQHAAQRLGLPIHQVSFEYGDSNLPPASFAGGSNQTASNVAAIAATIEKVLRELLALVGDNSPLAGLKYEDIEARDGGIFSKKDSSKGETYTSILQRVGQDYVEAEATSSEPSEMQEYSMGSYGAQFCEVRVNEKSGEVRVSRWLGSFDCGKILNPKTATSQFRGGIIMGIGMALTEETLFDERKGRIMNASLAEYHVPVNLDVPHIEIIYNDIPDEHAPLGLHGIGEIGITGVAAAIANAVFNATGKRIRELPITLDKFL
ncbi:xanthine dehydrogenase family protein molybdopterin-binding subunit [Iningainema tapete]|uniref:Xanthine dehydrogenase family protein molybdopterin-binding subunit n=1 Tax=Iningainema tapete BLCC-T55 TaxID=2748662 RepID=A0A8J6XSK0_9CYAN|nr:xanthine dehydrogenase family protein molybdopterin-binding subunit [Iningainema tapete]MBD2772873.1 xanthine dehydrogenase family protein molybdopterin-binding subunit [Iningainema tapete BLCC-T55]